MRNRLLTLFTSLIVLAAALWPLDTARAAVLIVTNLNDSGNGSLRAAIAAANSGDTIVFQSGLTGTISLSSSLSFGNMNLTIQGPGPSVMSLDGNNTNRIFDIKDDTAGATVTISGLTIQHGKAAYCGGGIAVETDYPGHQLITTLNIDDITFVDNHMPEETGDGGGAICDYYGTLNVNHSAFTNNSAGYLENGSLWEGSGGAIVIEGGGMYMSATGNISNSTFNGNLAGYGGGAIATKGNGSLVISNSTFYGNSSPEGGGIGTYSSSFSITVTDSTFSGNSTYYGYGGGIDIGLSTNVTLGNTIVAGNADPYGNADIKGAVTSLGNNLIGHTSGPNGGVTGLVASDQQNVNPLLNPLADNGGPTQTMSLQSSSPAIGMGNCNVGTPVTTDQRGLTRKTPACDVGAYETAYDSVVHNTNDHAGGSLRYAVTDAPPGTTVTFEPAVFNGHEETITLTSGGLTIPVNLAIAGPGAFALTVDGNNAGTVVTIPGGVTASISGLTITHGNGGTSGGGIDNAGALTLTNCALASNSANSGGGLKAHGGAVSISNCTFSGNNASSGWGGGVYTSGPLVVSNSTFSGNSAQTGGGGLYVNSAGSLTVANSTIAGNTTPGYGGGIYNYNSALNLGSSIVSGNSAGGAGPNIKGAVTSLGSNVTNDSGGATGLTAADLQYVDPLLGSLNYNGGLTMTIPLGADSPAIGMGNCNLGAPAVPVSTDQRSLARKAPGLRRGRL